YGCPQAAGASSARVIGGKPEKNGDGAVEADDVLLAKMPDTAAEFFFRKRGDLVHHEKGARVQRVSFARLDGQPENRCRRIVSRQTANGNGVRGVELVVLNDYHGPRFARIVGSAGRGPDFAPFQSRSRS